MMRQRNALLPSLSVRRIHLSLVCPSFSRQHPGVTHPSSVPFPPHDLFKEVRLLTGSHRPPTALHRIPNGLGAEQSLKKINQKAVRVAVRDIFPITMSG